MAAAMELHARIINAKTEDDEAILPPGFKFFGSMPEAPEGCTWRWDIETQLWASYNMTGDKAKCSDLDDGVKYAVGVKYLPNGFELGYNHYVGRLGMKLPETAELLSQNRVDWYEFCWVSDPGLRHELGRGCWFNKCTLCSPLFPALSLRPSLSTRTKPTPK